MDSEPSINQPSDLHPQQQSQQQQQQPDPLSFGASSTAHAETVCQLIISAINEAATNFEKPSSPATAPTPHQQHLQAFLSSLQPSLSKNLSLLQLYLRTNIFSLPSNLPQTTSLPSLLSSEATLKSNRQNINSLDAQISSLRAKIHNYDKSIQQATLKKSQSAFQNAALSKIQVENVTTSSNLAEHATQCINSSSTDLNASLTSISANAHAHAGNEILSAAAAAASHLTQTNSVRPSAIATFQCDEHGPLTTTTMPPVAKIFKTAQNQQARADQAPQISRLQALLHDCQ